MRGAAKSWNSVILRRPWRSKGAMLPPGTCFAGVSQRKSLLSRGENSGELDCKGASSAGCIADSQPAPVGFYDLRRDTEAKSEVLPVAAGGIRAVEALEDMRFLFVRNAGAVVSHRKREKVLGKGKA